MIKAKSQFAILAAALFTLGTPLSHRAEAASGSTRITSDDTDFSAARRGGGGGAHHAGGGAGRNVNVNRNVNRNVGVNRNVNVNRAGDRNVNVNVNRRANVAVRRPVRVWAPRPYFGTVVGGVALGTVIAAAAVGTAPVAPAPNMCWFWADSAMVQGYWDYCQSP